jgi:predicted ATP-binding protein involved in virulence
MRIKEIRIFGLFGMFDHTIPLNLDSHLSIIYGINGIGKTTIFKLLYFIFNLNDNKNKIQINKIEFEKIEIEFENKNELHLLKEERYGQKIINIYIISEQVTEFDINISKIDLDVDMLWDKIRREVFPYIKRIEYDKFLYIQDNEIMSIDEVISKLYMKLPPSIRFDLSNKRTEKIKFIPDELVKFIKQTNLFFIETQRLFSNENKSYVTEYSKEIARIIRKKQDEYEKFSESLQLSLGHRMSSNEVNTNLTIDELKRIALEVENRRAELKAVGLLENTEVEHFEITEDLNPIAKAVLSVNLQDMLTKLKVFDNLYLRLSKFLEILNERRLTYKKISISSKDGIIITNDNEKRLTPSDLSSGEQHELILLYLLLLKIPENSLILIDEPEISLHIDWQSDFLKDMEDIINLRKFDIVISTHSPDIVNGRTELTIPLHGKKNN